MAVDKSEYLFDIYFYKTETSQMTSGNHFLSVIYNNETLLSDLFVH